MSANPSVIPYTDRPDASASPEPPEHAEEERLLSLMSAATGLSAAPAGKLPRPNRELRVLVPSALVEAHRFIPLFINEDRLVVAVSAPLAPSAVEEVVVAVGVAVDQRI